MVPKKMISICGLRCSECQHFNKQCQGCKQVRGKPFWIPLLKMEICPIYSCCQDIKSLQHCGKCHELPCKTFSELRDPAASDEEFNQSLKDRQQELKKLDL